MGGFKRRGPPLFALLLVVLGAVLLLQNLNIVRWDLWIEIWRFWPLILVGVGARLVIGRGRRWIMGAVGVVLLIGALVGSGLVAESERNIVVERIAEPLGSVTRLDLRVGLPVGRLEIDSLPPNSPNLVEGTFRTPCGGAAPTFWRNQETASLMVEREPWSLLCSWNADWTLYVSPHVWEVVVDITAGAGSTDIDLTNVQATEVYINTGAADVVIRMPAAAGHVRAVITGTAANVDVRIPTGVEGRVIHDTWLTSLDVGRRFRSLAWVTDYGDPAVMVRNPADVYESPGYRQAVNRVSIELNASASSVTVR